MLDTGGGACCYNRRYSEPGAGSGTPKWEMSDDKTGTGPAVEQELTLDQFPSPVELWNRYCTWKGLDAGAQQIVTQDYYSDASGKTPRYYQQNAVNRTIEAIARGQDRILLVMATGTGKTYTAFQIIWRLWMNYSVGEKNGPTVRGIGKNAPKTGWDFDKRVHVG